MKRKRVHKYTLTQNGMTVACVESVNKNEAEREIRHYALMYSGDGKIEIWYRKLPVKEN